MKNIYSLLIIALISLSAYAQQKKDNTITIATSLPATEAFIAWGKHLTANGYTIDKSDATFFSISTGPKDTSKFNYDYIINSSVNDQGQIQVKMKWHLKSNTLAGTKATEYYDWDYAAGANNVKGIIFNDLSKVISSFGQYPVSYSVK